MSATTATDVPEKKKPKKQSRLFAQAQRLGRSLLLPIAVMPAAGILLRIGQPDLLGAIPGFGQWAGVISAAGNGVFNWLPLLFAVGIAIGWAKKSDGTTALAAVVGYMVMFEVWKVMSPIVLDGVKDTNGDQAMINFGVLGGIVMGLVSAVMWEKFHRTKMPDFLGFFSGRRLVPILTAVAGLVIAVAMSFVYRYFDIALTAAGTAVADNPVIGGGVFGFANRMLIPIGLHQLLNFFPWFQLGSFTADGGVWHGDVARFLHGDPTAGTFMTGFFPIMMFALPAGALAIWRNAKPQNRKLVGGIMISAALTSFVTGITEPLEYSFMFVAFPLYIIHAVLTGTSLALVNALGIHDGFSFSAGAIDYVLNFGKADGAIWLIPIGLGYAVVYYFLFSFVIKKWNLRTPGREEDTIAENTIDAATKP
ncbi:PTS transporter subunit EIIC [Curtobacterium flaccumfaciens]|uniref:PTS transporter subunit EIIC n=1 Tax=Curtobacterium flaccumfaciens TaxID=2035 RepID=UPI000FFE8D01|nr:PTS transporter subunit EIIC [Curtobacterium flaccumfaciens]MCS0645160.1 PTS transporter subunit EIIC [Curtobacterium flaccumfaciens pv. flaccumfaciens]MCS6527174.1 PTS transporter subunit EIIC [Curtobacterium flaccumfaciens pv. flaccumfaciens]MCS6531117.1 PTS transporter subunit EIIC [Curtobacterium flaccumfaciens pv. flaccumfaciens]NUU09129.1 PTS transporter subunit EIIC [Curtobacterium flaccumfaciens]RXF82830.1 PTS N-acetylglucosamine transporter subunit IIBC [Curtobacterium flaccumfacie